MRSTAVLPLALALATGASPALAQQSFVNWETPHVHPLELLPGRTHLLAVNLPDARLEVFEVTSGSAVPRFSVPVGLDPCSVRARTNLEAWVVNRVSDTVSVVNLATRNVVATIPTEDEPADVVFAGSPQRAFVSCSRAESVLVFDPADLDALPVRIAIRGEQPRALAVSPAGDRVYVAIFESGNETTVLGSGGIAPGDFPPDIVGYSGGPWGGQNPPPNAGTAFDPPLSPGLPAPPTAGLIVRRDAAGRWLDDNGGDWTSFVSGPQAAYSGRRPGWRLLDHDLALVDTATLAVSYADHLMNVCMALAVDPATGRVAVVGTEARNEIRFEPRLRGRFLRTRIALVDPGTPSSPLLADLNPHLDYAVPTVVQAERDRSLADPRGVAWSSDGTRAYVAGMGSDAVLVLDGSGARVAGPIRVGQGPTGVALDEPRQRLYVLDRFEAALSVVDTAAANEIARVPFFDPTPAAIRAGREYLYDARETSGLGIAACAACHVDARMDRLAWDLGDPAGAMEPVAGANLGAGVPGLTDGFVDFHPMKGPMLTPSLQDVVGREPFHWRGDRAGLEDFNPAFETLLGDDERLDALEMQALEDFLATIHFPPNPYRALDNSLSASVALDGHFTTGRFAPAGQPLPAGNAQRGKDSFRSLDCRRCHTLPTGQGTDTTWNGSAFVPIPPGPDGERHHALHPPLFQIPQDLRIAPIRGLLWRTGCDFALLENTSGFGFRHDGAIDSLAHFVSRTGFPVTSDQDVADLLAFLLCASGDMEVETGTTDVDEPPGEPGQATHAAVGRQATFDDGVAPDPDDVALLDALVALSDAGDVGLVAKGRRNGLARGWVHLGGGVFRSDRFHERSTRAALQAAAAQGSEITFTAVPLGSERRLGVDRDEDGSYDRDELDAGTDPADPASHPKRRFVPDRRRP